jgi:hypothetical protein
MKVGRLVKRITLAFAVLTVLWVSRITISFSAICPNCLQYAHGYQIRVLGIPCYYRLRPDQSHRGLASPDAFTNRIPPIDPRLYEKIMGRRCKHEYRKLGFCRYSWFGVACGGGGASRWDPHLQAIEQIYRAYSRIEDKPLAQQSFRIASDLARVIRSDETKRRELEAFGQGLGVISSRDDWAELVAKGQSGKLLEEDVRKDLDTLRSALAHTNADVRLNALERLADLNQPPAWEHVGRALSNPELAPHAAQRILWARYPPLLSKTLQYYGRESAGVEKTAWPFAGSIWPWQPNLSHDDIRGLLRQKDPWIDAYCLPHVWLKGRVDMIDEVLNLLNDRPTPAAKVAVEQLIAGRCPFYVAPFDINAPVEQKPPHGIMTTVETLSFSAFLTNSHCLTDTRDKLCKVVREILRLAQESSSANWPAMRALTDQWIDARGSESFVAAFAELLMKCDRDRTRQWLTGELKVHPDTHRFTCILTAVAVMAAPEFLPALEGLREEHTSLNWHQASYLGYAMHRCRRIHLWKLVQQPTGQWAIIK